MDDFEIKASSLHYRLATVYSDFSSWHDPKDICHYIRKCIRGFFNIVFSLFLLVFVVGGSTIHLLLGIYFASFHGLQFEMTWQMFPIFIILVLAFALGAVWLIATTIFYVLAKLKSTTVKAVKKAAAKESPPFYITAYRSIKQKTCVKIKVVYDR